MINKLESWSIFFAAGLLFILPFTHTVAIRILCLTLSFGIVLYQWKRLNIPKIPCRYGLLAWLLLPLILLPFAIDPSYSLHEIKTEVIYGLAGFFTLFALTQDKAQLKYFLLTLGVAVTILSLWGTYNFFLGNTWFESGRHGGSASFASYTATIIPLFIPAYFLFPNHRKLLLFVLLIFVLAATLAAQRILILVFFLQVSMLFFWLKRKEYISAKKLLSLALIGFIILSTTAYFVFEQKSSGIGIDIQNTVSSDIRITKLYRSIDLIRKEPITGHGFGRNAMKLAIPHKIKDIIWHAHNTVLNYGIELGIPGIILILSLFSCLAYQYMYIIRKADKDKLLSAIGVAGLLIVAGVFLRNMTNDMFHRDLSLLFWCINGLLLGFSVRRMKKT